MDYNQFKIIQIYIDKQLKKIKYWKNICCIYYLKVCKTHPTKKV